MANGGSIGFGVLTKSNVKFMNRLCEFLKVEGFATLQEIYNEYMSKPKSKGGGGANLTKPFNGKKYDDEGRWGSIKPTKNSLAQLLNRRLPFVTNEKYLLCEFYGGEPVEKKKFWSLNDNWESELENYKIKLDENHNVKTMKKYHTNRRMRIDE